MLTYIDVDLRELDFTDLRDLSPTEDRWPFVLMHSPDQIELRFYTDAPPPIIQSELALDGDLGCLNLRITREFARSLGLQLLVHADGPPAGYAPPE